MARRAARRRRASSGPAITGSLYQVPLCCAEVSECGAGRPQPLPRLGQRDGSEQHGQCGPGSSEPQAWRGPRCQPREAPPEVADQGMAPAERARRGRRLEAPHRSHPPLEKLMITFQPIVQVLGAPVLGRRPEGAQRRQIAFRLVARDAGGRHGGRGDGPAEEGASGCSVTMVAQIQDLRSGRRAERGRRRHDQQPGILGLLTPPGHRREARSWRCASIVRRSGSRAKSQRPCRRCTCQRRWGTTRHGSAWSRCT